MDRMDGCPPVTEVPSSLERVYRDERDKLWRALLLFCGDQEVASDAVAEASTRSIGHFERLLVRRRQRHPS
jgi:DNA-directed RNA polymerase specialized sigma24 family protein